MYADPNKVGLRKIKRHIKAGVSIVLAVAAGAFLACQKSPASPQEGNPGGPDGRRGQGPSSGGTTNAQGAGTHAQITADASATTTTVGGANAGPDAGVHTDSTDAGDTGIVLADAGEAGLAVRDAGARTHRVDRQEHRSGMPVRDNLLE